MKNIEKYTEIEFKHLIADISRQQPILSDAETLLAETIIQLPNRPLPKLKISFEFYRIILNTAAVFLIGLFIFQYVTDTSDKRTDDKKIDTAWVTNFKDNPCKKNSRINLLQYKELYACYLENNKRTPNPFTKK